MSRSWIDFHFSGVIPRIVKVIPLRVRVHGKEGDGFFFCFLLSALLGTLQYRLPSGDVCGRFCRGGLGVVGSTRT